MTTTLCFSLYAFSRGGVVVRAIDPATAGGLSVRVCSMMMFPRFDNAVAPTIDPLMQGPVAPRIIETPFNNQFAGYIPQYSMGLGRINSCDDSFLGGSTAFNRSSAVVAFANDPVGTTVVGAANLRLARVAADDCTFQYFLGVPRMIRTTIF